MAFSLRNKFEEAVAQIVPFDGKTAATVRAARAPVPPTVTPQPTRPLSVTPSSPRQNLSVTSSPSPAPRITVTPPPTRPRVIAPTPEAPKPTKTFKGFSLSEGQNKTIMGKNAAWMLPKAFEKKYNLAVNRDVELDQDRFLMEYDKLNDEFQRSYTNQVWQQADQGDQNALNTLMALRDSGRLQGDLTNFIEGSNDKLYGGLTRGALRIADWVLPGVNTFGLEKAADQLDPTKNNTQQFTAAGAAGEQMGMGQKGVVDTVASLVPTVGAQRYLENAYKVRKGVAVASKVPKIISVAANLISDTALGLPITAAQQKGQGNDVDLKSAAATTLAVDAGLPLAGTALNKGMPKIIQFAQSKLGKTAVDAAGNIARPSADVATSTTKPAAATLDNITTGLEVQKFKDADSFYAAHKAFFDDNFGAQGKTAAQRMYAAKPSNALPSGASGTRISSGAQTDFEYAMQRGDKAAMQEAAQRIDDPIARRAAMESAGMDVSNIPTTNNITNPKVQEMIEAAKKRKAEAAQAAAPPKPSIFKDEAGAIDPGDSNMPRTLKESVSEQPEIKVPKSKTNASLDDIKISKKETKAPVRQRIDKFFDDVQSAAVDRYHAIDQFVESTGKKVAPSQDPRLLIKRYSGGSGIASLRIDDELKPIIKQTDDFDGLRQYMVAQRMNELYKRGIGKRADAALTELEGRVGKEGMAKFQKVAEQLYDYQKKNLDMLHEAGALSDESYEAITKSNQKYVPFQRVMDDLEQGGFIGTSSKDLNVKSNGIKRIKGSDRDIVDPLESIIKQTYDVQKVVEKQRVLNSLVQLGEFKKIDPQIVPVGKIDKSAEIDKDFMDNLVSFAKSKGLKGFRTHGNISRGRLAYYQPGTDEITRHFGTSSKTTAHEVGHFFDSKYGLKQKFYAKGESKAIGQEMIDHMKTIGQSKNRTSNSAERFAHSFEWWLTHRDRAARELPLFSKRMQQIIDETPDLKPLRRIHPTNKAAIETATETVFGKSPFEPKAPHITVLEGGKPVFYETDKALADAIKGIDEEQLNLAIKAMSLPAKTLRAGATALNVGFAIPNVVRDQLSAAVNNKYGGVPIYDFISGLSSVLKQDEYFKNWMRSGADQASFFAQDRTMLQRTVKDVTGGKFARTGKLVKNPLELLRALGEFSEKGSRVGVFKRALKGAGKEGFTGVDQSLLAMKESREATIDFARRGSKMKAYNAITPFLNARLQGSLKLMQSIKTRPVQTMAIGAGYVSVPAAILYAHNSQYADYDEIPDYVKENNFIIMTGNQDTPFVKIPKGEIGSIFGNPVEKFFSSMKKDDPDAFKKTMANIGKQFLPVDDPGSAVPTGVSIPMQLMTNYDTFRKQNIVSPYKKDLPPELQFDKNTSETAKKAGELLKQSPAKLEFALRGVTGGVGKQATQLSDMLLNKFGVTNGKPTPVQDLPVIDRFLGEKKDLSASAQKIYEQTDKLKKDRARENYDIKKALERGDTSVLEGISAQRKGSLERSVRDDQIMEQLSPRQKALYSSTQEQRDLLRESDPSLQKDLDYVETLKKSGSSGGKSSGLSDDEEASFRASGKKTTTKNNRTYYIKKDGSLASKSTFEYKADKKEAQYKLDMDRAKDAGDLKTWQANAIKQYDLIKKRMNNLDPETEAETIAALQLKAENLRQTAVKYNTYGGFKKPKSGSRRRSGTLAYRMDAITQVSRAKSLRSLLKAARV